ncbi:unnamed protein product [Amoebophrya sp. A120]|nr:unnamed protein product [Amoebophrya sp. A120]|eukprot:GSA120T00018756001.1
MAQYGKQDYWDERYTRDPEPFDWYQRWSGIRDIIAPLLKPTSTILIVGAGNSRMAEEMFDEGFANITNIDSSAVAMKAMAEKYKDKTGLSYSEMNVKQMDYGDGQFGVILDKGTMDSILCGEASTLNIQKALTEIARVLDPKTGVFVSVSHGQPNYRLTYLDRPEYGWDVTVHTVEKPRMAMQGATLTSSEDKDNVYHFYQKAAMFSFESLQPEMSCRL